MESLSFSIRARAYALDRHRAQKREPAKLARAQGPRAREQTYSYLSRLLSSPFSIIPGRRADQD